MDTRKNNQQRLLICGFEQPHLKQAVTEFLDELSPAHLGLLARHNYLEGQTDSFLCTKDTRKRGHFPDQSFPEVPSRSIIEAMIPIETEVLKMMDRMFRSPFKPRQYEFRKRYYLSQLTLAYHFVKTHGFTRVIFSDIPHDSFNYILYGLCKALEIEASFFYQLQIKDSFVHAHDFDELFGQLSLPSSAYEVESPPLPAHFENEVSERCDSPPPFYLNTTRAPFSDRLKLKLKRIFRIQTYTHPVYSFSSWLSYYRIPKINPAPDAKFLYFALDMQPETTTSPMGRVFVDQYYAILMLARCLPEGVTIVVKEHPMQELWQRTPDFYKLLKAEPKVQFASMKANSFSLIERSLAVATITGTVGWEALFLGKPVIVFGEIYYKNLPGVMIPKDNESLTRTVQQIVEGKFPPCRLNDIRVFLHHAHQLCHTGVIDGDYFEDSLLSPNDNNKVVKQALRECINP